ncbi:prephenate dehydrogenase-like protein [Phaeobacter inhibens]|uniref:Prephenate dehydrogenase-like protein n=1 Tax=Phaeobacter inhibens TaxID=221822 RepID=A0A2I7GIF8_9RHOB|nr:MULTISPECIES: prephenate dehydrogenase [Phaeobacter]AFO86643.1 prephenate dehydrogenase-like protein [Phaeobacter inhibens 2.10]AUQ50927.1 prephenate dehydrogenase-like protein [Phaeobacter inhibens]AUQ53363.1 prephenate dehydrogenase-like protein [Phaeobacter inhibens]AUQ77379.1 prephenate dehydrogenase-like protein [Phaeobacter inhibens]AUQ95446.1 prephenate dehydrogenase-like protein [Phaeobacter inhibens]
MPQPPQFSRIGLIGFGAFGRLIARHLSPLLPICVYDPVQTDERPRHPSLRFGSLAETAACPLVILAVPVGAMEPLCHTLAPLVRPGTWVLDVGSVKMAPADVMQRVLPPEVNLLGTHPLFGPESTRQGLAGQKIALCPLRGGRPLRLAAVLRHIFRLEVIWTTPEAHDRELATVQGLTHLIAQALNQVAPETLRMTTASFELMQQASRMVTGDAPGVLEAILRDNPFAADIRDSFLERAADLGRHPVTPRTQQSPPNAAGF